MVDDDPLSRALQARLAGLLGYRRPGRERRRAGARHRPRGPDRRDAARPRHARGRRLHAARTAARRRAPARPGRHAGDRGDRLRRRARSTALPDGGFNDHLAKPIEVGALEAALARNLPHSARPPAPANDAARVEAAARRLAQASPGDARFGPTLLETFAMRSGQLIEEITRAHAAGDAAALAQSLKALTTSAEFMGASGLAALCDSLRAAVAVGESAGQSARTALLVQSLADEHQSVLDRAAARRARRRRHDALSCRWPPRPTPSSQPPHGSARLDPAAAAASRGRRRRRAVRARDRARAGLGGDGRGRACNRAAARWAQAFDRSLPDAAGPLPAGHALADAVRRAALQALAEGGSAPLALGLRWQLTHARITAHALDASGAIRAGSNALTSTRHGRRPRCRWWPGCSRGRRRGR
ncbi:MAG: hypothetical protein MZV49_09595 [Rhodopseudomonas palustris]|nr:hypothetical protein [Rhodopseudomonas palustris]